MYKENYDLTNLNTMQLQSKTRYFANINSIEELVKAVQFAKKDNLKIFVLGSGSNVLLNENLNCLTLHFTNKEITIIERNDKWTLLNVDAGIIFNDLVNFSLEHSLSGIENLSLIPGTVGAAPIQNIGAYGVELKDVVEKVYAYDLQNEKFVEFNNQECQFAYRDSIFKQKGHFIIYKVCFQLNNDFKKVNLAYKPLAETFKDNKQVNAKEISNFIVQLRKSKLPDPKILPNTGSFFKNPEIPTNQALLLKENFADLPLFATKNPNITKLAAGFLIDKAGFKGLEFDKVKMYDKQALVLVNFNKGNLNDVLDLASKVKAKVKEMFNVDLEIEPPIINY